MADVLPSLFRWEPGMRREGCPDVIADVAHVVEGDRIVIVLRYLEGDVGGELAEGLRPDMSHAGTRGLVLEQVRAALGDPHASVHRRIRRWSIDTGSEYGWSLHNGADTCIGARHFDLEGDAILDALHRAEARP